MRLDDTSVSTRHGFELLTTYVSHVPICAHIYLYMPTCITCYMYGQAQWHGARPLDIHPSYASNGAAAPESWQQLGG